MLTLLQALIFGIVQGVTELFPISSLGHSVLLPSLLGWHVNQSAPLFLPFLVATHLATATVLFFFFLKEWVQIGKGFIQTFQDREIHEANSSGKLAWLLIAATVPAGITGVLFEKQLQTLFADPKLVATVLIGNGLLLFGAEILRRKRKEVFAGNSDKRIAKMSFLHSAGVGILQCIALIPGFSRTGATMTGGLLIGLSHEDAMRFSFLLATPIIAAAALLKVPDILISPDRTMILPTVVGFLSAGCAAYLSVRFLTKYFETKRLTPFAIYCVSLGVLSSLFFFFR